MTDEVTDKNTIPTIHINGTDRGTLLTGHTAAIVAIDKALDAIAEIAPNGRDYYPQGPNAIFRATADHAHRVRLLLDVRNDLNEIAEGIGAQ